MSARNDVSGAADTSGTVSDNANVGQAFGGAFGIVPFSPLSSAQNAAAGVALLLNPRPLEINRQNTHNGLSILEDAAIFSENLNTGDFTTNTAPQASGDIRALLAPGDCALQAKPAQLIFDSYAADDSYAAVGAMGCASSKQQVIHKQFIKTFCSLSNVF
jgi:hypothetical protein